MRTVLPDHVETFLRAIIKMEEPIRASDVAKVLGVHPNTVKRIPVDELPYFTFGARGDRRYTKEDVRAYVYKRRVDPCECGECRCPYPSKPGTERNGHAICWRCKEGRHTP